MFNRNNRVSVIAASLGIVMLLLPLVASAHHEAMFGPQSSAVLTPGTFISAQVFERENGRGDFRHRETTSVFSAGIRLFKNNPLSLAFLDPIPYESSTSYGFTRPVEHPLLSTRYPIDASGVAKQ